MADSFMLRVTHWSKLPNLKGSNVSAEASGAAAGANASTAAAAAAIADLDMDFLIVVTVETFLPFGQVCQSHLLLETAAAEPRALGMYL
jgi:hypothetical protein